MNGFRLYISLLVVLLFMSCESEKEKGVRVTYVKAIKHYQDTSERDPRILENLEYELICNDQSSRFVFTKLDEEDESLINSRFIGQGGGRGLYYKNIKSRENLIHRKNLKGEYCLIENEFEKYTWSILSERKTILGYSCTKAIGTNVSYSPRLGKNVEHKIEAWYSPELKYPFGPAGYDGLPGLVLEARSASYYFIANEIIKYNEVIEINRPILGHPMTMQKFRLLVYDGMRLNNEGSQ